MTRYTSTFPVFEKIHLVTAGTSALTVLRVDDFFISRISALILQNSNTGKVEVDLVMPEAAYATSDAKTIATRKWWEDTLELCITKLR